MIKDIIFIICGLYAVLKGADRLTDGAVKVARRFQMAEFVIGLTIVAFGTSMPELCVSMASALNGTADMAVGNVVGSNIFNIFLIVGLCAVVAPIKVSKMTVRVDLPMAVLSVLLLVVMLFDGTLAWYDSAILFLIFVGYMVYMLKFSKNGETAETADDKEDEGSSFMKKLKSPWVLIPYGLLLLVLGSEVFVHFATSLAQTLGASEALIGITILGAGTSMPELATSLVAARKGQTAMALGNVVGSCVFNILCILGITGMVVELTPQGISIVDLSMMALGAVLMWMFSYTRYTVERWEGVVLTAIFVGYMTMLILQS